MRGGGGGEEVPGGKKKKRYMINAGKAKLEQKVSLTSTDNLGNTQRNA